MKFKTKAAAINNASSAILFVLRPIFSLINAKTENILIVEHKIATAEPHPNSALLKFSIEYAIVEQ